MRLRSADRPPTARGRRARLTAAAVVAATAFATLPALLGGSPALAMNGPGTPPYWAQSPFNVPSGTGASVPFTEYEAEAASTNGTIIGPDFTQGDLATEASGREAVQLSSQGQYVQFTLTSSANAFDVHYSVPQGSSGTLSVYVNGNKLSQQLSMTSAYSYITTGNITGSKTHKLYDDVRMMFGQTYGSGTTVRLQVDSGNTATPYTIDVADFYNAPAAASQPSGSLSVTNYGADPTGANDSSSAFNNAVSAANSANESVWIPPGTYKIGSSGPATGTRSSRPTCSSGMPARSPGRSTSAASRSSATRSAGTTTVPPTRSTDRSAADGPSTVSGSRTRTSGSGSSTATAIARWRTASSSPPTRTA
jgi:hypothetical protein